jgi:hypothetical protein
LKKITTNYRTLLCPEKIIEIQNASTQFKQNGKLGKNIE